MMKTLSLLSSLLLPTITTASPAMVWTNTHTDSNTDTNTPPVHSSDLTELPHLLSTTLEQTKSTSKTTSLQSVVFLISHNTDHSGLEAIQTDGLTSLTQSGHLPKIASHAPKASAIHHHIRGIENFQSVTRDAKALVGKEHVLVTTLEEFTTKLPKMEHDDEIEASSVYADGRAHAMVNRQLVVVKVGSGSHVAQELDEAVEKAILSNKMGSVILTSVRSKSEVDLERQLLAKSNAAQAKAPSFHKRSGSNKNNRRRLEDRDGDKDEENDGEADYTGIYFVSMTPNILSGLLFGFFFIFVSLVGIGQLGNISSQDCYVDKYPVVGREN